MIPFSLYFENIRLISSSKKNIKYETHILNAISDLFLGSDVYFLTKENKSVRESQTHQQKKILCLYKKPN